MSFIVFEGGEGSGKSTQARILADRLGALLTFEPGATTFGAALRALLLDPDTGDLDDRAEALLMAADRAQHVSERIRPALEAGRHVVTDRFVGSSLAYQGFGRGLDRGEVRMLSAFATRGLEPDLVILLETPRDVASRRLGSELDRIEAAGVEFHDRVAAGFSELAAGDDRWVRVEASGAVDEVTAAVDLVVATRLGL